MIEIISGANAAFLDLRLMDTNGMEVRVCDTAHTHIDLSHG